MLSKRKLRNKSGSEGSAGQEESPVKKSLRRQGEEQEEQKERPIRSLRQRDKPDNKDGDEGIEKQKTKANDRKIKPVDKSKTNSQHEAKSPKVKGSKDEGDVEKEDKKYESVVGPIKMSDRKSGDANMFRAKLQPVTIKISKNLIDPKVLSELKDETKLKCSVKDKSIQKPAVPEKPKNSTTTADPESTIIKLVESPAFDELDITSKIEILDTSKKKLEEIKRKSDEQQHKQKNTNKNKDSTDRKDNQTTTVKLQDNESKQETKIEEPKEEPEKAREDKWKEGEKILCFHGPLIYDAKIQRVEIQNGIPKYFIHYHGWNKNWDEWVPEARMLKFSDQNVEIQKDLCRAHEAKEKARKMKQKQDHVFAVPKTPSPIPKKENQGRRKSGLKPKKRENNQNDQFLVKNGKQVNLQPPDSTVESEEQFQTKLEIKIKI